MTLSTRKWLVLLNCLALGYLSCSGCTASPIQSDSWYRTGLGPVCPRGTASGGVLVAALRIHCLPLARSGCFMLFPSCWDFGGMLCRRGRWSCVCACDLWVLDPVASPSKTRLDSLQRGLGTVPVDAGSAVAATIRWKSQLSSENTVTTNERRDDKYRRIGCG